MAYKRNYKRKKRSAKKYSVSERRSYRNGFLSGLFAGKKKKSRSLNDIPLNNQHNVLFSDERYSNIYRSYIGLGLDAEEAYKLAVPKYKEKYGDSVLKKHYEIT